MKKRNGKLIIFLSMIIILLLVNMCPILGEIQQQNRIQLETSFIEKGNIMVTGFWNPTGQMIRPFSTNNYLNPSGWKGENWENSGYNIYSYFPTPDIYNGTFEVDYQNTWDDFWTITSELNPVAIISFGAGAGPWEIENNSRNLQYWINDENKPYQPTPSPPDDTVEAGFMRHSTLPVQVIEDEVNENTNIEAWVDWEGDPGRYLCEYIAYLGMWYQDIHSSKTDPNQCKVAGFIHVNSEVYIEDAMIATNITIRKTIEYLDSLNEPPSSPTINGPQSGKIDETHYYNVITTDPEGGEVSYYIDWGDNSDGGWTRMLPSGEEYNASHIWNEEGTFTIKVKAKDYYGSESDWTTLEVSMPRQHQINLIPRILFWLLEKLL
jgi:pyrrolidone-carboxylate peptidase